VFLKILKNRNFSIKNTMLKRRDFMSSLPLFSFLEKKHFFTSKPVVISTWDSGIEVNEAALKCLMEQNKSALDAAEAGAIFIEDQISCCVGLGGNPDREGKVTLDACIMDSQFNCGGVAFLERIKHPISVARKVMENTSHVLLAGKGAQDFALNSGFFLEEEKLSVDAAEAFEKWKIKSQYSPKMNRELEQRKHLAPPKKLENGEPNHDTMALLVMDQKGDLSGACTTSGQAFKINGRVGDSPIIGAGLYVDNAVGAATSSGQGEEVIRVSGSAMVVEFMRNGKSPEQACKAVIDRIVKINPTKAKEFQVGFIAINKQGKVGAYAVNPGFVYSLTYQNGKGKVYPAKSYFK
jgi:N4-(beta-N-acetylglucosaminyl)-L-asparaginase